jgi:hypothetical protein
MEAINLPCSTCKHFNRFGEILCDAFPEGIPEQIVDGSNPHKSIITGQVNDFVYDPQPWANEVRIPE